jgi:acyl-CoA reductase-like NAD-dependent aldehyde dehydrogenase
MVISVSENDLHNIGTSTPTKYLDRNSPVDNSLIFRTPLSGELEVNELFSNIKTSSKNFQDLGIVKASRILLGVSAELQRKRDEINQSVFLETGKTEKLVEGEFETSLNFMIALAGLAQFEIGRVIPSVNPNKSVYTRRFPVGIAALITSHNTPLPNYAWKLAPSFLSLNASILKPSEFTSQSAQMFVESFLSTGAPEFMVNLLLGGAATAQSLIAKKPDLISFTGSFETGMKIKSATQNYSPKLILELGGSNPIIVCESADLEKAASAIAESAISNSGQRCASASRLIVHKSALNKLMPLLQESIKATVEAKGSQFFSGCLVSKDARDKHEEFIKKSRTFGSKVIEFDYKKNIEGCYVNPAIVFRNQKEEHDSQIEIFSPILFVENFQENEEALQKANSTPYGLTAAIWTNNFNEAFYFSSNVRSGIVNINGPTHGSEFQFPFGGQGNSGNGTKEVGINCLSEYSFERLISVTNYEL